MSSLPTPSHLSTTPIQRNRHRHRRSAAISGDFDVMGLGLFLPQAPGRPSPAPGPLDQEFDAHFRFNNEEDFRNHPKDDGFAFPDRAPDSKADFLAYPLKTPELAFNKTPDLLHTPQAGATPSRFLVSPSRKNVPHNLNSPIRLNAFKSTPKTRFFLTEETNLNNANVPDAVIDLDDILNANLHIGDANYSASPFHKRTELVSAENYDDEFLASPFLKLGTHLSSPHQGFVSSPMVAQTLFQQPIQEQAADAIEEDDDEDKSLGLLPTDCEEMFINPQQTLGGIYSNSSANSSSSSLRSGANTAASRVPSSHLIEKTFSNSSRDSVGSSNAAFTQSIAGTTPTGKRSGAKANRYQSFYDQSFKISNALKVSSSDSVDIVKGGNAAPAKILGHSSSLPSLKSNVKRVGVSHPRFTEVRFKTPEIRKISPPPIAKPTDQAPSLDSQASTSSQLIKNITSSPVSVTSEVSSAVLSTSETIHSTDHSSLISHGDTPKVVSQAKTPTIGRLDIPDRFENVPPAIVVSSEADRLSSSTNSTFGKDETIVDETVSSPTILTSKHDTSTIPSPTRKGLGRPMSPSEEKILKLTQIPTFKKLGSPKKSSTPASHSGKTVHIVLPLRTPPMISQTAMSGPRSVPGSPEKVHHKSKSFLLVQEFNPRLTRISTSDDTLSVKLAKRRSSRLVSWFRKK